MKLQVRDCLGSEERYVVMEPSASSNDSCSRGLHGGVFTSASASLRARFKRGLSRSSRLDACIGPRPVGDRQRRVVSSSKGGL